MTIPRLRSALALSTVAVLALTACTGKDGEDGGKVAIGFVASLSGTYQTVGEDMRDGFQLYLDTHEGKLGGRKVDLVIADEGDGPQTALPAATRLVQQDNVDALAGIVGGGSYAAIADLAQENKIPLVGANARPDMPSTDWLWHTSYISDEPGIAIAPYVKDNVNGPVYAIGPDYQGGHDELRGFVDTYTKLGGTLANPTGETTWTPFPATTDFLPYLNAIAQTDAKAVYCFYAGKAAIDFVKQYAQSDVADLPLYGAFLTEGAILDAQGDSAKGIRNVLNYSPDLDNPANRTFVSDWSTKFDRQPTTFAMASYDAAAVLDHAIGAVPADQEVTPELINNAIGSLGTIDSPRGPWQFSTTTHSPIQRWYLREVALDGTKLSNLLVEDLATIGG